MLLTKSTYPFQAVHFVNLTYIYICTTSENLIYFEIELKLEGMELAKL